MKTSHFDTLIFGASGPVGQAATAELRARGLHVATVGRSASDFELNVLDHEQVSDFFDAHNVPRIVYLVRPDLGGAGAGTVGDAVRAFSLFVSAAGEGGLERFVFASSAAVYGDQWSAPVREDDALAGESAYAIFKRESESVLTDIARDCDFASTSLRIFNVYGPGCHGSLINKLRSGPPPDLMMTSSFVRDYIHSSDVARLEYEATASDDISGPINVGTGVAIDNLRLAELAGWGTFHPVSSNLQASYSVADTSKANAELNFRARFDLAEFLRR